MTESTAVYRPSPRPRPAGDPARQQTVRPLHVVPPPADPMSEVPPSGSPAGAPSETISAGQSGSTAEITAIGFRVRAANAWSASRDYWTPPAVFTGSPASLAELATYAKSAPWTHQQTGILRALGVGWYRFVGYPYTVVSRYREWLMQRPGRLIPALGLLKLFALTGPGDWVVHTVVYPVAQFAGHVFL